VTSLTDVIPLARRVADPASDPAAVAALVAWSCGPRRSLDALRRRLRDAPEAPDERPAAERLASIARDGGGLDGPLADVAGRVLRMWASLGVRVALVGDAGYPVRLAEGWPTLDAPVLIAWRGAPPAQAGPAVAVVGARNATGYGTAVAGLLATAVARAGGCVVSGGAVGVDAAAHAAAMGLPGGTTVVLGCGHAVGYPAVHARPGGLFEQVLEHGGTLVSELLPETGAHPGVIRARNRIVAGLADVTVVVEGGSRSGALLTAGAAAERGREVLAVPGDITAPGSAAPLRLLGEGARACTGPEDVLALLPVARGGTPDVAGVGGVVPPERSRRAAVDGATLPGPVLRELERAGARGLAVEDLALVHPGGAAALLAVLTRARIEGLVEDVVGGVRLRASGSLRVRGGAVPGAPRPSDR